MAYRQNENGTKKKQQRGVKAGTGRGSDKDTDAARRYEKRKNTDPR